MLECLLWVLATLLPILLPLGVHIAEQQVMAHRFESLPPRWSSGFPGGSRNQPWLSQAFVEVKQASRWMISLSKKLKDKMPHIYIEVVSSQYNFLKPYIVLGLCKVDPLCCFFHPQIKLLRIYIYLSIYMDGGNTQNCINANLKPISQVGKTLMKCNYRIETHVFSSHFNTGSGLYYVSEFQNFVNTQMHVIYNLQQKLKLRSMWLLVNFRKVSF